jgi:hypothetical protein
MNVRDLIKKLVTEYDLDDAICATLWTSEDVDAQAEIDGVSLSLSEQAEIVERLESNFDANIGINWEVIAFEIDSLCAENA